MWDHFNVNLDYLVRRATFCGWEIATRCISNYELVFVLSGQGDIIIDGRHLTVHRGDLICFRPGMPHSLSVPREPYMEFYGVHFTLPPDVSRLPLPDDMKIDSPYRIESLFKTLLEVYNQKPCLYRWQQNLLLEQILCEIFSVLHQKSTPIELTRIKKVLASIHDDPARPFTLEELSLHAGVKKTLFLKAFRSVTGTTPRQYIQSLRLEHARDLLLDTDQSVTQIAGQCGYSDSFYFSRCFKNYFGASPQQYRREHLS